MIKGLHHVSMKTSDKEKYCEMRKFYVDVLGLNIIKETENCMLIDTGCGIIEIFSNGDDTLPKGNISHFAFSVDNVQLCAETVEKAGYEVFIEPKKVYVDGDKNFPAEIAFCRGPIGEEIEFFHQMW